jgi:hypothetical protein
MQCQFCHEEGVRQSLSEVGGGYVVQATCGSCGSGWCAGTFNQEQGDAMKAAQEKAEREAAMKAIAALDSAKKDK